MNFSQLSHSLENALAENQSKRGKTSLGTYQKGLRALIRASEDGFQNKKFLHIARRSFFEAIQNQRQSPDGYLGMGYLLLLINYPEKAHDFIVQGLQLSEDKSYAQELLSYCQRQIEFNKMGSDEEDRLLIQEMRQAYAYFQQHFSLQGEVPWQEADTLGQAVQQGFDMLSQFEGRLEVLENEIDLPEAHQLRQSINAYLNKLQEQHQCALQCQLLYREMQDAQRDIVILNKAARQREHIPQREEALEDLLDRCDAFADQLDTWGESNWGINDMLQMYERLVIEIETLQEMFDA